MNIFASFLILSSRTDNWEVTHINWDIQNEFYEF